MGKLVCTAFLKELNDVDIIILRSVKTAEGFYEKSGFKSIPEVLLKKSLSNSDRKLIMKGKIV